jgi:hypothetical protein
MISTESLIELLFSHRRDKLALTCLLGFMAGDSVLEAWIRLDNWMPVITDLSHRSGKSYRGKDKIKVDHDIAQRVLDIAKEIEPWLKQLAEKEMEVAS